MAWSYVLDQGWRNRYENSKSVRSGNVRVPDNGCSVAPSCVECPLPDCQYDVPSARAAYLKDKVVLSVFGQHEHLGTAMAAHWNRRPKRLPRPQESPEHSIDQESE
jgi:hypothetical protein